MDRELRKALTARRNQLQTELDAIVAILGNKVNIQPVTAPRATVPSAPRRNGHKAKGTVTARPLVKDSLGRTVRARSHRRARVLNLLEKYGATSFADLMHEIGVNDAGARQKYSMVLNSAKHAGLVKQMADGNWAVTADGRA